MFFSTLFCREPDLQIYSTAQWEGVGGVPNPSFPGQIPSASGKGIPSCLRLLCLNSNLIPILYCFAVIKSQSECMNPVSQPTF